MTKPPLRAMIVDDEAPAREGLRLRLRKEPDVTIIGEFGDVTTALAAIRADQPDILFLDIEMPGLDGFGLLSSAGHARPPAVVFVTAHDTHAIRAFDVRALDYLLKPVEQSRLREAIDKALAYWEAVRKGELADRVRGLVTDLHSSPPATSNTSGANVRIPIRQDGSIQFVNATDIDWIDASGDAVTLHAGKTAHVVRKSMGEILAMLDARQFIRIHRSTIVNMDRVKELQPWFHGEYVVVLRDGVKLKLSRGYRDQVAQLMGLRNG